MIYGLCNWDLSAGAVNPAGVGEDEPDPVELPRVEAGVPEHQTADNSVWELETITAVKEKSTLISCSYKADNSSYYM